MTPPRAAIRVFLATPEVVIAALDKVLAREGYVPFPADRVPAAYPADRGEFTRAWIEGGDALGATTLALESWRPTFARALALAKALPAARLAAAVHPPGEALRVKTYAGGDLVLAIGPDDDEELFYRPVRADAAAIARLLADWGLAPAATPDPGAAWRSLAPGRPVDPEGRGGPRGELRLYARADSRLVAED